jgi:hypothetical protein
MQVDTPNDDVRTALEAIGFRTGSWAIKVLLMGTMI